MYVSFHFVSLFFVTSIFQIVWSVTSCFRDFQLYLIHFICYKTEMLFFFKKKMYVSAFHLVSFCFITSIFQIVWSVSSCFRDFPLYLIRFIVTKQKWVHKKKKQVCFIVSFHFILFCNKHISNLFGLFHPVSEFFLYILFVSFVMKQK